MSSSSSSGPHPIQAPLRGDWRFLCPPGHHPHAFDFVRVDPRTRRTHSHGRLRKLIAVPASSHYCWQAEVHAPVDGLVFQCSDGWPDHARTSVWASAAIWYNATFRFRPGLDEGFPDIRPNAGNYVFIQTDAGYLVFLAHLARGSLSVRQGQTIRAGEVVGRVGNSGNSTEPHLHINLFDQMDDPLRAQVLPLVFAAYESQDATGRWQPAANAVPAVGSMVRFD